MHVYIYMCIYIIFFNRVRLGKFVDPLQIVALFYLLLKQNNPFALYN